MTPQDQIKAIAELDGWTDFRLGYLDSHQQWYFPITGTGKWTCIWPETGVRIYTREDYLTSHDAIIPVIQRQSREVLKVFWEECERFGGEYMLGAFRLSPS